MLRKKDAYCHNIGLLPLVFTLVIFSSAPSIVIAAINTPTANPVFLVSGVEAEVVITTYIPDQNLIPTSVNLLRLDSDNRVVGTLGTLRDDGSAGDEGAGDRVYTIRLPFTAQDDDSIKLRITAAIRGSLRRTAAEFSIPVVAVPAITNNLEYNQAVDNIFNSGLVLRSALQTLRSNQALSIEEALNLFDQAAQNSLAMFSSLSSITKFEAAQESSARLIQSVSASVGVASMHPNTVSSNRYLPQGKLWQQSFYAIPPLLGRGVVKNVAFRPAVPQLPGLDEASAILNINEAVTQASERARIFGKQGSDPRVSDIATFAINTSRIGENELDEPSLEVDRIRYAVDFERTLSQPDSLLSRTSGEVKKLAIKKAFEPATDLIGDALDKTYELGVLGVQAVKGAGGKLLDFFSIPEASGKGLLIAEVSNPENIQVPVDLSDFIYSFGGSDSRALFRNVQIFPNIVTPLTFSPGITINQAQFLSFIEGNPGIPGDGIIINNPQPPRFRLAQPFSLSGLTNGFTFTVFLPPGTPSLDRVSFPIQIQRTGPCGEIGIVVLNVYRPTGRVLFNGVQGSLINVPQSDWDNFVRSFNSSRPGCNYTLNDFAVNGVNLNAASGSTITRLDAAAIGRGQNNYPGTLVP